MDSVWSVGVYPAVFVVSAAFAAAAAYQQHPKPRHTILRFKWLWGFGLATGLVSMLLYAAFSAGANLDTPVHVSGLSFQSKGARFVTVMAYTILTLHHCNKRADYLSNPESAPNLGSQDWRSRLLSYPVTGLRLFFTAYYIVVEWFYQRLEHEIRPVEGKLLERLVREKSLSTHDLEQQTRLCIRATFGVSPIADKWFEQIERYRSESDEVAREFLAALLLEHGGFPEGERLLDHVSSASSAGPARTTED